MNTKIVIATRPAQADTRAKGYVTQGDFHQVTKGMSIHQAHRIFGTKGTQSSYCPGSPSLGFKTQQDRQYKTAKRCGSVDIAYHKVKGVWTVKSKHAFWG